MLTILYFIFSLSFGYLLLQLGNLKKKSYALILFLVLAGLLYDNLIIAIGSFIGENSLLKVLSAGRFYIHAFFTPTMIIFGFGVLRKVDVKWAQGKTAHIIFCLLTTLLLAIGVYTDILRPDLQVKFVGGILRYINEGGLKGPPVPAILTIIFLIVAGISLWRSTGWKWLAVGSILMVIAAGMGMGDLFYIGNLGEVILNFANVYTATKFIS